jgi:prophage regulatory protein
MSRSFLRLPQVEAIVGLKKSSIYKLVKSGQFPAPVKLSRKASAWPSDEVDDWQQRQIDSRNSAA